MVLAGDVLPLRLQAMVANTLKSAIATSARDAEKGLDAAPWQGEGLVRDADLAVDLVSRIGHDVHRVRTLLTVGEGPAVAGHTHAHVDPVLDLIVQAHSSPSTRLGWSAVTGMPLAFSLSKPLYCR